ncbi:hypothetical protein SB6422_00180 [Klebsiella huaxiensis]|uniref:Uncharacterized protein n=1 Tax=Klebsiella huaxiensis TaxID=2153354 RepID=A0A564GN92_9ENTR|nr:hypothetical protein SB6422_00180 [Klebsiella huaxiensis]
MEFSLINDPWLVIARVLFATITFITHAETKVITDHANTISFYTTKIADVDTVFGNYGWSIIADLSAEVIASVLLSNVKFPAPTMALVALTFPLISIASASNTA